MSLQKITILAQNAEDRLIQQDKDRIRNSSLVRSLVSETQEVEDAMYEVYTQFGIYTAIGTQLDTIGLLVGETRNGRDDTAYRVAILARIQLNVGAGEPDTIINAIKQWMNPTTIVYNEPSPAYFTLFIQSAVNIPNIASIVKEISPAGIGSSVTTLPSGFRPFCLGTVKGSPDDLVVRSNDLIATLDNYAVSNSDTLIVNSMKNHIIDNKAGLGTAYPVRTQLSLDEIGTEYNIGNGDILELKLINDPSEYAISIFGGRLATVKI